MLYYVIGDVKMDPVEVVELMTQFFIGFVREMARWALDLGAKSPKKTIRRLNRRLVDEFLAGFDAEERVQR